MRATDEVLKPDAQASGGSVHWLEDGVPDIRRVDAGDTASGSNWFAKQCKRGCSGDFDVGESAGQ
jgi:hypothetical protein